MTGPGGTGRVVLVDAMNYLFRSYHAIRDMRTRDGMPTNAVYGLAMSLVALREAHEGAAFACVMDPPGPTFRHELYPEYKSTRKKTDQELLDQIEPAMDLVRALGMGLYRVDGFEADDVIATLARQGTEAGAEVMVASSDKDLMCLAAKGCRIINPKDNEVLGAGEVEKRYGVPPERMVDYLVLVGDTADNVPGVPGVGPKTAAKWLAEYGDLDGVLANQGAIKGKVGERLRAAAPGIGLSVELVTLRDDVEVSPSATELGPVRSDSALVAGFCERMRFNPTLRERMLKGAPEGGAGSSPAEEKVNVEILVEKKQLAKAASLLEGIRRVGLHAEVRGADAPSQELVSVAVAAGDRLLYLPLRHEGAGDGAAPVDNADAEGARGLLGSLLDGGTEVCVFGAKPLLHALRNEGIAVGCDLQDAALMAYCMDSTAHGTVEATARRFLDHQVPERKDVVGGRDKPKSFAHLPVNEAAQLAAAYARAALDLRRVVGRALDSTSLGLYRKVERPVTEVLAAMERTGVLLDAQGMAVLSAELKGRMSALEGQIAEVAGEGVNLNSPAQLSVLLYDKLGLDPGMKTRGGARSTREFELERLARDGGSPVPQLILDYRHVAKLVSTYTEPLPKAVNSKTGRLHTRFVQTGANTGRLASTEPNLQNIPIRSPEGKRIRSLFVAPSGSVLVSADYSQIELRILAHFSGDSTLIEAFANGEDVHARTAAELYGVGGDAVTADQRRFAKAINFGLIYGMGAFGLAQRLGIPQQEAQGLISAYFERLPGVRAYLDSLKEQATEDKSVTTLFGRRISVAPRAPGAAAHGGAMRAALNAPMQGTAADIMKLAMAAVYAEIIKRRLQSRIILQVHDELVLEAPEQEVDELSQMLPEAMGKVAELKVALEVDIGSGGNWGQAH